MNDTDVSQHFESILQSEPNVSDAVAAIRTLLEFIKLDSEETLLGLRKNLVGVISILTKTEHALVTTIASSCELFLRFITLTALDHQDFQECKRILMERGELFLQKLQGSRQKIARLAHPFIRDGSTILTHSRSRVVLEVLKEAAQAKKRFTVYVTESKPDNAGEKMQRDLEALKIPSILILDAAVGYIMEKVDLVMVGAEGVAESGGIINKIGTCTIGVCAREMNKPLYVVAESLKFIRLYPLNQQDVPSHFKYEASKLDMDLTAEHPKVDYTPPAYITLLFTDLGILTPSAVSDELIKLYR